MASVSLDLVDTIRNAWTAETAIEPASWQPANPAQGQCAVTALVVQDLLGGELLRCETPAGSHYWNLLPDGSEIDLTRDQFSEGLDAVGTERRARSYVLSFAGTSRRYELLRARANFHVTMPS